MKPYYELAYALESKSLCFFVGTGFSKYITDDAAPNWLSLLKDCCSEISDGNKLIEELFPNDEPIMSLEECASVITLQMMKEGKELSVVISTKLNGLKATAKAAQISSFALKHPSLKFITTNYDLLIENDILKGQCCSFSPGFPVHRQRSGTEIYHVHGCIKHHSQMVITADDYYNFINSPSYFSKKLDSLIEENTTIIIGYSLGDINFKSILNARRHSGSHEINRQHLFFLSRRKIPQHVKDYYDASYGLRVIENTEVNELIVGIEDKLSIIAPDVKNSSSKLINVLSRRDIYDDIFLKKRESFIEILSSMSSISVRVNHPDTISLLKDIIQRKHQFTNTWNAWEQYDHLAEWLTQLGCVMDLGGTALETPFLDAVKTSFQSMSKDKVKGKSWEAYLTWKNDWSYLTYGNRSLIREHVKHQNMAGDFDIFIKQ